MGLLVKKTFEDFSHVMTSDDEIKIRFATSKDIAEVIAINYKTLPEHYSNSFYSKKDASVYKECKPIKVKNPLSKEFEYLRNYMLPGLLKAVS